MAIDPDFLELLRCPETRQRLREADSDLLDRVNALIRERALRDRSGEPVKRELDGGLVRSDGTVLYPIWDDLPDLLVQNAIQLEPPAPAVGE